MMIKTAVLISFFLLSVASSQEVASKTQPEKSLRRQQRYVSQSNANTEFWARELQLSSGNRTKKAKDNKYTSKNKKSKKNKDSKSYKHRRDLQKEPRKDDNAMDNFWERELEKSAGKNNNKASKHSKHSKQKKSKKAKKSTKSYKYNRRDLENEDIEGEYVNYWDRDFSDIEEYESEIIDNSVDETESLQFWERELAKSSDTKNMKDTKKNKHSKQKKSKKAKKSPKSYKHNRRNEEVTESDLSLFWERELDQSSNRKGGKNAKDGKHSKGTKAQKVKKSKKGKRGKSYTYKRRLMSNEEQYVAPLGYSPSLKAIIEDIQEDVQQNVRTR